MYRSGHEGRIATSAGLGRRDVLKLAMSAGMTFAAASTFADRAPAQEPKSGGLYRWGSSSGSLSNNMDPTYYGDPVMRSIAFAVRNCLIEVGPTGELLPELAEEWESTDGRTWRFLIRKGVEFHNGHSLAPRDVVASINVHRAENSKSPAKALLGIIAEIREDGQHVEIVLNATHAEFPAFLSFWQIGICPAVRDGDSVDWESGTGTGGYRLVSFEPGSRISLTRNGNYWKSGRAHFEGVEVVTISDANARTNALVTGEVDAIDSCDSRTAALLQARPGVNLMEIAAKYHYTFAMRTDQAPFNDNNVRMALKLAIDREALVRTVLSGHGVVGNDHPVPVASPNLAAGLAQRGYDPEQAKSFLRKAGLERLAVDLHASDAAFVGAVDSAVMFREQAAAAGIDINVIREPADGYWSKWPDLGFRTGAWAGRPTDEMMFTTAYSAGSPENETKWNNERFNALLVSARAELDGSKRREIYVEMQTLIRDDGGAIIPMFANLLSASSDKIQHGALAANWEMDGARHIERWWFM